MSSDLFLMIDHLQTKHLNFEQNKVLLRKKQKTHNKSGARNEQDPFILEENANLLKKKISTEAHKRKHHLISSAKNNDYSVA